MKIAIINNLNIGSTGNLSLTLKKFLSASGYDVRFFHAFWKSEKGMYRFSNYFFCKTNSVLSLLGANRYEGLQYPTKKLLLMLEEYNPDLINIQCLNMGSVNLRLFFEYVKKKKIPIIATCHAFFYSTGNCGHPVDGCTEYLNSCIDCKYRRFATKSLLRKTGTNFSQMKKWFEGADIYFTCVSDYVTNVTKLSPLTKNFYSRTILNGVDTNIFYYRNKKTTDKKIRILFTCSDVKSNLKGFPFFLDLLERFKDQDDFIFYFIGKANIKTNNRNFINLGLIHSREEMAEAYQNSDLTIMLSKVETFGMPVAESLCCGTPVAFFKCGGTESIAIKEFSMEFEYGDLESLAEYILSKKYILFDKRKIEKAAKEKYDINVVNLGYLELIDKIRKNKKI